MLVFNSEIYGKLIPVLAVTVLAVRRKTVPQGASQADVVKSILSVEGVDARITSNELPHDIGVPQKQVFRDAL
jgi:hypothetical protein